MAFEREMSSPPGVRERAKSIGIELNDFGNGKASMKLEVEGRHLNIGDVAHGGVYSIMLDMALGGALLSVMPVEEWCATTMLNISFITPAKEGTELIANGRLVKRGKNVAHLEGEILNDEGIIFATAKGTWAIWNHKPFSMK